MTLSELIADMAASHPDNRMFACFSKAEILDRLRTALDDKAALTAAERDLAEALALLRRVRDCTALVHVCLDAEIEDFLDALLQRHGSVDVRKTPGGAEAETKGKEKTEVKP